MYGIDDEDKEYIDNKLNRQRKFLKEFVLDFGGKEIDMLDNTYSANINPKKYFSEINNRVNSIHKYGKDNGLMPVFITITSPSKYHPKRTLNKKKNIKIDNKNYGYKYNFSKGVKDASVLLSKIWHNFTMLQVVRKMKKDTGHGLIYFRVYEPTDEGVPHIHAMVYIPKSWVLAIKKKFYEHFRKVGIKQLQFKYTWYNEKGGAVAYMMKYITKTFRDSENEVIDDCVYWYIKHRIMRFCSSRSLAPLSVYRKVRYFFKDKDDDYIYVSSLLSKGIIQRLFNSTTITYKFLNDDFEEEDIVIWGKKYIPELSAKKYIFTRIDEKGKKRYGEISTSHKARISLKYEKKEEKQIDPLIFIDDEQYSFFNNELKKVIKIPSKMNSIELIRYFNEIDKDIESVELAHYGLVKNELIKRNLLREDAVSLNDYNLNFNFLRQKDIKKCY